MELYIVIVIPILIAAVSWIVPDLPKHIKYRFIIAAFFLSASILLLNTAYYKHWRYYDEEKFKYYCIQVPPLMADNDNFYYRYLALIYNQYHERDEITDLQVNFQSSLHIDSDKILICDFSQDTLGRSIKEKSYLSIKVDRFKGGECLAFSIDCHLPKKAIIENRAATINISFRYMGRYHNFNSFVNPMTIMDFNVINKKSIVFDYLNILDNRQFPKTYYTYHFYKGSNESGDRQLEIYCSNNNNRLLHIKYEHQNYVNIIESEKRIPKGFNPLRIIILENNNIIYFPSSWYFLKESAAKHYKAGMESCRKNDYINGAEEFQNCIKEDNNIHAWFYLGLALEHLKEYVKAIDAYRMAIKINGNYAEAYAELGCALIKNYNIEEAFINLKKAIELNPQYSLAYYNLGRLQISQGNYREGYCNIDKAFEYESRVEKRNKFEWFIDDADVFADKIPVAVQAFE